MLIGGNGLEVRDVSSEDMYPNVVDVSCKVWSCASGAGDGNGLSGTDFEYGSLFSME